MSKISRMHNVQIPDRTFVILVTMTDGDCEISCEDFFSSEEDGSQDHDAIKVIGNSIMNILEACIENTLIEMGQKTEETGPIDRLEDNVVYLKPLKTTKTEQEDA